MDIDLVIPWVDGTDPEWLSEKNKYSAATIDDSNSVNRYRDMGLLKYWFRSVECFIPWFRKIHFVTWGHVPEFLDTSHPKLNVVLHKDYIRADWLPTFSANVIEMNMHLIKGLSEHFIYFNDDTFIIKPMQSDCFFKNGRPCLQASEMPLGFIGKPQVWSCLQVNDIGIINKYFSKRNRGIRAIGKYYNPKYAIKDNIRSLLVSRLSNSYYFGFKNFHCPSPFTKSVFEQIWSKERELLELTSSHRFRSKEDVNQWLALWWQMASGNFEPRKVSSRNYGLGLNTVDDICYAVTTGEIEMLCINDNVDKEDEFESLCNKVANAFEQILPNKSSFER